VAEFGQQVVAESGLVASDRRGLVALTGAGADDAATGALQPLLGCFGEQKGVGCAELSGAKGDLGLLAPATGFGEGAETSSSPVAEFPCCGPFLSIRAGSAPDKERKSGWSRHPI
jgi:hypothetical protein